jgi:hypothetical protein
MNFEVDKGNYPRAPYSEASDSIGVKLHEVCPLVSVVPLLIIIYRP